MRPLDLPAVRAALLRAAPGTADGAASTDPALAAFRRGLGESELFWATADMINLARDVAAREITDMRWLPEDRPALSGLLVAEGGFSELPVWRSAERAPTQALAWAPHPDGLVLTFLVHRGEVEHLRGRRLSGPPLVVTDGLVVPVEEDWQPLSALPLPITRAVVAEVQACWALLRTPVVDTAPAGPGSAPPPTQRPATPESPVTVIQLRRAPSGRGGQSDRRWQHRWVVRMHARWQACGPGRSQRRRILVGPYVKGPAAAPMLAREHVHLWRQ